MPNSGVHLIEAVGIIRCKELLAFAAAERRAVTRDGDEDVRGLDRGDAVCDAIMGDIILSAAPRSSASNDLSLSEILDLRRAVAELREDAVVISAEFRGDANMARGVSETTPPQTVALAGEGRGAGPR
jgi:hypothetical protein